MSLTLILAHGGGLVPLMIGGSLAVVLFVGGICLAVDSKKESRMLVGMGLIGASFLIGILTCWLIQRMM